MSSPLLAGDDRDGADVVAGAVLVVGAVDRLLHRRRGVIGAEQDAVLLGGGVGPVGERLVGVVLVVAAPLDPLAGVQHGRVAELLEVRLIEALGGIERLAERAVGLHAGGGEAWAAGAGAAGGAEGLDLPRPAPLARAGAAGRLRE